MSGKKTHRLIRKDKKLRSHIEAIRAKLIQAEPSGFVDQTPDEILADFKSKARRDGKL